MSSVSYSAYLNRIIFGIINFRTQEKAEAIEHSVMNLSDGARLDLIAGLQDLPLDFPERRRIDQLVRGIIYSIPNIFRVLVQAYPDTARATNVGRGFYMPSDLTILTSQSDAMATVGTEQGTLFHWAVVHYKDDDLRQQEIMKTLLMKFPDLLGIADEEGDTPLHVAANGASNSLPLRLARRAPEVLDSQDSNGLTLIQVGEESATNSDPGAAEEYLAVARALEDVRENAKRMRAFLLGLQLPLQQRSSSSSSSSALS